MSGDNSHLEHYGVKGQQWGVRKKSKDSSSKTKDLSNDDLKRLVERLRLEQQYSELANPRKQNGKKYVGNLLRNSGSQIVGAIVGTTTTIAVTMAFGKHVARSEAAKELAKESFKKTLGG